MNETTYTGEKSRQALIRIERIDDQVRWSFNSEDGGEFANILAVGLVDMIDANPKMRRVLKRAMRRVWYATLPDWIAYWIDGWPFTLIGVAVLTAVVYGFGCLMHWIGAC